MLIDKRYTINTKQYESRRIRIDAGIDVICNMPLMLVETVTRCRLPTGNGLYIVILTSFNGF